jgi:hypothetical protein
MSNTASTEPITPARFAAALKDLDLPTLRLKVLEIRNSIAHLLYSNAELRPFADGTAGDAPDPVCADAIRENEEVLARMAERVDLARAEVQDRGASWALFEEDRRKLFEDDGTRKVLGGPVAATTTPAQTQARANGTGAPDGERSHPAWSDGTIQVGTIRLRGQANGAGAGAGGSLSDEELVRRLQERMREMDQDDEEDGGMHL